MEFLVFPLVVGVLTFVAIMLAYLYGLGRRRGAMSAFQQYVAECFPELPEQLELLVASRRSKGWPDVALLVAEPREEIIVVFNRGRQGMTHLSYPFGALSRIDSTSRIISRGLPPLRKYSYEQTMTVTFSDGTSVPFFLETLSKKHGTDKARELISGIFAPWEETLNGIRRASGAVSAGWYPDPAGRCEWRWWDGRTWTSTAASGGRTMTDPHPPPA